MNRVLRYVIGLTSVAAAGLAFANSTTQPATQPATRPYPLTTCVVSGESLGSMGSFVPLQHEGREVRFCCKGCIEDFKADPARYLKLLDEAEAKTPTTVPATQPASHDAAKHHAHG